MAESTNEQYGIRRLDKKNFNDLVTYIAIDQQPESQTYMLPKIPSKLGLYSEVMTTGEDIKKDPWNLFAITNKGNEVIGWVQCLPDGNIDELRKQIDIEPESLVLEVTYAKLFIKKNKNVAVKGLKLTMNKIIEMENKISNNMPRTIYFTGYTDPKNIASEKVLELNEFKKLDKQILYEQELNNAWIKKLD